MQSDSSTDQERLKQLKHELKKYESAYQIKHGRAQPREEIKKDAVMWKKYGEYNALRKRLSMATRANSEQLEERPIPESIALKERPANVMTATPSKHRRGQGKPEPLPVIQQTPAWVRAGLGPTPQRDGAVLGIFDGLPEVTPSKDQNTVAIVGPTINATPSKAKPSPAEDAGHSKTPQSSGKRFFLGAFAGTPLKRKGNDDIYTPNTAKRHLATPAFLRRSTTLPTLFEERDDMAGSAPPFKKRGGLARSFSTIIQDLRKQEEKRMDDDWDIMNELEAEERGEPRGKAVPKVLVEDSQVVEMPLGPDQGVESEEDEGEADAGALDANGKPRKVWKKKGLKRQTRKVNMKPVLHKPRKAVSEGNSGDEWDYVNAVEETQMDGAKSIRKPSVEEHNEERHDSQQEGAKSRTTAKEGSQNAPKKVRPQDHANFRRLNIKNKNSKAKGRGRFGRR